MKFIVDTVDDDYCIEDTEKLKKLGFHFKRLKKHQTMCAVFEWRKKRPRPRIDIASIEDLIKFQRRCRCPIKIDGMRILIIDRSPYPLS